MGDLLDLFLDFERKLISLIRDLLLHPKRVADSIVAKDKAYLGAFKFYTFSMSMWIVMYQLGNGYFDFFPESYVLPHRLISFLESERNLFFLIAPFAGLIEFFFPIAILNWLMFRKREFTWLNHITLNLYIAAIILFYALFAFIIGYVLEDISGDWYEVITIILILIVPAVYYGYVYARIFGRRIFFSFVKSTLVVLTIGYTCISLFLEQPFHELLHRKIFFSKYNRYVLPVTDSSTVARYRYNDSLPWFVGPQQHGRILFSHAFAVGSFISDTQSFHYQLWNASDGKKTPLRPGEMVYRQSFIINQIDSPRHQFVLQNRWINVFEDTVWLSVIDEGGELKRQTGFSDHLSIFTRLTRQGNRILFSGNSRAERKPVIGELTMTGDRVLSASVVGDKEHFIDYLEPSGNPLDSTIELVVNHSDVLGLKEFTWMRGTYHEGRFHKDHELTLHKNLFNPTPNFSNGFLHKGKVLKINDSLSIASFQVMTDSSFAINVTRIHSKKGSVEWNRVITLPQDMFYNDEMIVDENAVYLLGRAAYIFSNGWSINYHQVPYVMVLDVKGGEQKSFHFLPINKEDERVYQYTDLESIYQTSSSAYREGNIIYWNLGGVHSWMIDMDKLKLSSR